MLERKKKSMAEVIEKISALVPLLGIPYKKSGWIMTNDVLYVNFKKPSHADDSGY
jgi:hypothetical protein